MDLRNSFTRIFLFLFIWVNVVQSQKQPKVFDVEKYGAIPDGKTDNVKAFLKAWDEACKWEGRARVLVPPKKIFMIGAIIFNGKCKGPITFYIKGILKAPSHVSKIFGDVWIKFQRVDNLSVSGGGILDGQGAMAWPYNKCHQDPKCPALPSSVRFNFINNGKIHHIKSINSKNTHFTVFACNNINFTKIRISAPRDSPNTDGIKIERSTNITISRAMIGTGDDCVSILSGSKNVNISQVFCGPGHGISVGSLGKYENENDVFGIFVKNCTFFNTSDGLRIKTWASPMASKASNFIYEDIFVDHVGNPIIIDQEYCPYPPCDQKIASHVEIRDVKYKNIWGNSGSKVAVTLRCSKIKPCQNIVMEDINITHDGPSGPSSATCSHVNGDSFGIQIPPSCI